MYLKAEFLDAVYLQQDSFDPIDAACSVERQTYVFRKVLTILGSEFSLANKDEARTYFNQLRQNFIDWNVSEWQSKAFKAKESDIDSLYAGKNGKLLSEAAALLKDGE